MLYKMSVAGLKEPALTPDLRAGDLVGQSLGQSEPLPFSEAEQQTETTVSMKGSDKGSTSGLSNQEKHSRS